MPPPELGTALRSREAFARFALDLEAQAVSAYVKAAAEIRRPGLRRPLGSIMACEAAHEVALRAAAGAAAPGGHGRTRVASMGMGFITAPGPLELLVILVVALLVLGPKRLPEAARSVGRGMRELKDSLAGVNDDDDEDERDHERERSERVA